MDKFKDLEYVRPDLKKAKKDYLKYYNQFKKAKTFEEADSAFLTFQKEMEKMSTQGTIAHIRNTMNMKDEFYDGEIKYFNRESPKLMLTMKKVTKAMLTSPFRAQFEEKYGKQMFKDMEVEQNMVKPSIILPTIKVNNITTEYSKTVAACSVDFMGEKCNFYGLLKHMQSVDRDERKAAFNEWAKLYENVSDKLDSMYSELVKTRVSISKKIRI